MNDYIEPLVWATAIALIVVLVLVGPDALQALDSRPGKWVSVW